MNLAFQTPFTDAQIELLGLFKTKLNQHDMQELRQILLNFKFKKMQNLVEEVVQEKGYTEQDFEQMKNEHHRTPYKNYRKNLSL